MASRIFMDQYALIDWRPITSWLWTGSVD